MAITLTVACATVPVSFHGAYMRSEALKAVRDGGMFVAADHASLLVGADEVVIESGGSLKIFEVVGISETPLGVDLQIAETRDVAAESTSGDADLERRVAESSLRLARGVDGIAVIGIADETWVRIADAVPAASGMVAASITTAALFSRGFLVGRRPWVIVGRDQPGTAALRKAGEERWIPLLGSFEALIGGERGGEPIIQLGDETYELQQQATGLRLVPTTTASTDLRPGEAVIEMEEMADPPFLILSSGAELFAEPDPTAAVIGRVEYLQPVALWQRSATRRRVGGIEAHWYLIQAGPLIGWVFGGVLGQRLRPIRIPEKVGSYAAWEVEAVDSDLRMLFGRNARGPICAFGVGGSIVEMQLRAERCRGPGQRGCSTEAAPVWGEGDWATGMLLDLNRDARLDPVCVFQKTDGLAFCPALSTRSETDGESFVAAGCYSHSGEAIASVTVADQNSDGHDDLRIGETWVLFNPIEGHFGERAASRLIRSTPAELVEYAREVRRDPDGRLTMLSVVGIDADGLAQVAGYHHLSELYIRDSRLASLPGVLEQLVGLTKLYVENGDLRRVPPLTGSLPLLEDLDLEGNSLEEVGPELFAVVGLKRLDLSRNQLVEIPAEIGRLVQLTTLELASNQLRTLPPAVADLTMLKNLELYGNQLETIPEALRGLGGLVLLGLGRNMVTELPPWLGELANLEHLDLANNRLTALPRSFGELQKLRWLDLSANRLTTLPASIAALTALERLELRGNPLPELPRALRQLDALREISWARARCVRDLEESIDDFITRCSRLGAATLRRGDAVTR